MKILQLNVWTGRIKGAVSRFIEKNNFDVICLQEVVWSEDGTEELALFVDTFDQIKKASGLEYEARSCYWEFRMFRDVLVKQGNVILSRYPIVEYEDKLIYDKSEFDLNTQVGEKPLECRAQKVRLDNGLVVLNHHGYWLPEPLGNETSVECMHKVAEMIKDEPGPVVMCGDLNVIAESPAMRELDFLHDLMAENGVKTTLANLKFVKDVACDHILVSDGMKWDNFTVHSDIVSDHLAVSVEIKNGGAH